MRLGDVRQAHLQHIANSIDGASKSAVQKMKMTLNQLFGSAYDNQLIPTNPAKGVKFPNANEKGHRALEPWERTLITEHWQAHRSGIWALTLLYTGLRIGELIALTWDNVNFETNVIAVVDASHFEGGKPVSAGKTKTKAGIRSVPMPQILKSALSLHKESLPPKCPFVAFGASGEQVTKTALRRGWDGLLVALETIVNAQMEEGAPTVAVKFDRHDLRHTYCTMLYTAGVDIKTAMQYMGHDDMQTTSKIYTHLDNEKEQASRALLEDYINKTFSTTTIPLPFASR